MAIGGADFERIDVSVKGIYAFTRKSKQNEVIVYLNLGSEDQSIDISSLGNIESYTDHPFGEGVSVTEGKLNLPSASTLVLTK